MVSLGRRLRNFTGKKSFEIICAPLFEEGEIVELEQAILSRRSIRAYKSDPVPPDVLRDIIEVAKWAPSFANTQPWEFTMVGGDVMKELRTNLRRAFELDPKGKPDFPLPVLDEPYMSRLRQVGFTTLHAAGIPREEMTKRKAWRVFAVGFFDAPNAIILSLDRCFTAWGIHDVGVISFALMLLAHARGLGTCAQAGPVRYPWVVREALQIPEDKLLLLGLAIGYPDSEAKVNSFTRSRASLDEIVSWKGILKQD